MEKAMPRHLIVCVLFGALGIEAIGARPLQAQQAPTRWQSAQWSLDVSVGNTWGSGGDPLARDRNHVTLDLSLVSRFATTRHAEWLVGMSRVGQLQLGTDAVCWLRLGTHECIQPYPVMTATNLLFGVATSATHSASLRLMAGPGVYQPSGRHSSLGLDTRISAVSPSVLHLAFLAQWRAAVIPNSQGTRYRQQTFTMGIRVR
jgi:hypothetical protein